MLSRLDNGRLLELFTKSSPNILLLSIEYLTWPIFGQAVLSMFVYGVVMPFMLCVFAWLASMHLSASMFFYYFSSYVSWTDSLSIEYIFVFSFQFLISSLLPISFLFEVPRTFSTQIFDTYNSSSLLVA